MLAGVDEHLVGHGAQPRGDGRGLDELRAVADDGEDAHRESLPRRRLYDRAPMRLLVTGGAGYIGSIVAQQLLARGDEVTVLDSLYRGHRSAIPEGAAFEHVDLLDAEATRRALDQGFDGVLHFAALALVGESVASPERYYHGNVVASLHLLDAMRAAGVKRLVFSSTCATYGEPENVPIAEDEPPSPVNAYGNSKLAVDRMLADEARAHGLGAISLRYFNVGGASGPLGEDHEPETHLIPLVLRAAAGTTDARLDPRHGLPDRGRHGDPRLHPRRGSRPRAPAGARPAPSPAGTRSTTSAPARALGARGDRDGARGHRARDPGARGAAAARRPAAAGRRHREGPRAASGWLPSARSRTWSATPGQWHQAHPGGY